jgi:hypothetical protein
MLKAEEVFHIVERKFFTSLIYKNPEMKIQDLVHDFLILNHIRFVNLKPLVFLYAIHKVLSQPYLRMVLYF